MRLITDERIKKLPKWAQNVIGSQQREIERLRALVPEKRDRWVAVIEALSNLYQIASIEDRRYSDYLNAVDALLAAYAEWLG